MEMVPVHVLKQQVIFNKLLVKNFFFKIRASVSELLIKHGSIKRVLNSFTNMYGKRIIILYIFNCVIAFIYWVNLLHNI